MFRRPWCWFHGCNVPVSRGLCCAAEHAEGECSRPRSSEAADGGAGAASLRNARAASTTRGADTGQRTAQQVSEEPVYLTLGGSRVSIIINRFYIALFSALEQTPVSYTHLRAHETA